jgi:hypothetical protein
MAKIRDLLVFYGDGERIFADQFLSSVRAVFEVGIGSINPNIRAHMGPHGRPGRLCVHGGSFFRRH